MRRWVEIVSVVTALSALLVIGGCAPKQQAAKPTTTKVAGTREQASTVTATLTKTGLTVTPASVPAGMITIKVMNKSTTPRTVAAEGAGMKAPVTKAIPANATGTLMLDKAVAGKYKIYVVGMEKTPAMSKTLTVTSPASTMASARTTAKKATVDVTLTGKALTLKTASVPTGAIELLVKNNGTTAQTVGVKGPGLAMPMTKAVKAKSTATITLANAAPGKYMVYVVGMEKTAGMSKTLTVTKKAPTPTTRY